MPLYHTTKKTHMFCFYQSHIKELSVQNTSRKPIYFPKITELKLEL